MTKDICGNICDKIYNYGFLYILYKSTFLKIYYIFVITCPIYIK